MHECSKTLGLAILAAAGALAGASVVHAQQPWAADRSGEPAASSTFPDGREPAWGTASETAHTLQAFAFELTLGNDAVTNDFFSRHCTDSGFCNFIAPVLLPGGAVIQRIELDACDNSSVGQVVAVLRRIGSLESSVENLSTILTGDPEFPGCAIFTGTLVAPATATFDDVPSDSTLFPFVEALVASGITAGCGNGNYCPGAPLTRGQMAVFLAKALGLHWAP